MRYCVENPNKKYLVYMYMALFKLNFVMNIQASVIKHVCKYGNCIFFPTISIRTSLWKQISKRFIIEICESCMKLFFIIISYPNLLFSFVAVIVRITSGSLKQKYIKLAEHDASCFVHLFYCYIGKNSFWQNSAIFKLKGYQWTLLSICTLMKITVL